MKRMLAGAAALLAAPLLWTPVAQAAIVSISLGTITGAITYQGNGNNTLTVSAPALSGLATSTFGSGTFSLTAFGPLTTGTATLGVFPILTANTESFVFTSGANFLDETFTLTTVNDGSLNPHVAGTDVVTGGSAAFLADFGRIGSTSTFDLDSSTVTTVLETLAMGTGSETPALSSGETDITPLTPVPEPASLLLLGTALLGMGLIWRHRKQA